jgi:hypothetical protein
VMFIPDPDPDFSYSGSRGQKAPDPGSGSVTLVGRSPIYNADHSRAYGQISYVNQALFRLDPDSIRSADPDPDPDFGSGSGSRRIIMTHKNSKKKFHVLKCWMFSFDLRAACFSCSLADLCGGLGISKLQFLIKNSQFFSTEIFFSKPLIRNGFRNRIRIGICNWI